MESEFIFAKCSRSKMHKIINSPKAPQAVGPYSQAILAQGSKLIFISGQIPLEPKSMSIVSQDIREQTVQVLKNLSAIICEAQASLNHVVKTTVYLKNMNDFNTVNEEYNKFFNEQKPARVCVEVARLPKDALVEIDAIVMI